MKSLNELYIGYSAKDNRLTAAGIAELLKAKPDLRISGKPAKK